MASRYEIEVNVSSAKDIKNVNWRNGPNRPYAVVWVDPKSKWSTKVDDVGDTKPDWNETLAIPLPHGPIEDFTLYIDIVHAGSEEDTKPLIGSARLKFREVLEDVGIGGSTSRTLKLKRPSGRPHGKVEVKVTIREPGYRAHDSYYAPPYGVPPAATREFPAPPAYGNPYDAPPPTYDPYYSAAPPAGHQYRAYNAQPQPYGQPSYGYSEGKQVYGQEEKKKSKYGGIGTGLAVGAVAGVLGGLAISEGVDYVEDKIADDVAERVEDDLGYDGDDF